MSEGKSFPYWVLITPVIAVFLIGWAIYLFIGWWKFGESYFNMASVPARIGGVLAGVIETSVRVPPDVFFRTKVACVNKITTGYGKTRSVQNKILWRDEVTRNLQEEHTDGAGSEILVEFQIPPSARESDSRQRRDQIIWYLEVSARLPGRDYAAVFEVPVFMPRADSRYKAEINSKRARKKMKKDRRRKRDQRSIGG